MKFANSFYISWHEKGQSLYNNIFNWDIGTEQRKLIPDSASYTQLNFVEKNKVNSRQHKCNIKNDSKVTKCTNNALEDQLMCKLPWLDDSKYKKNCHTPKDFENFVKTSKAIGSRKMNDKLEKMGCLIPNCKSWQWERTLINDLSSSFVNKTYIRFFLPSVPKVTVQEEIRIYDMNNFIADVGGYIGLMLGMSILSFFDQVISLLTMLKDTISSIFIKNKIVIE